MIGIDIGQRGLQFGAALLQLLAQHDDRRLVGDGGDVGFGHSKALLQGELFIILCDIHHDLNLPPGIAE